MSNFISLLSSAVIQLLLFSLVPFLWWVATARNTNFFKWLGLKKPVFCGSRLKLFAAVVGAAGVYIAAMFLIMTSSAAGTTTATSQFSNGGLAAVPSVLLYAVIQTSLSEEIFFRGFLCKRLSARLGFSAGNIIQSLLFGLLHGVPFGVASGKWSVCVLLTLLPAAMGYFQGWLNEKKSAGSIFPSWALHALMNVISALSVI